MVGSRAKWLGLLFLTVANAQEPLTARLTMMPIDEVNRGVV